MKYNEVKMRYMNKKKVANYSKYLKNIKINKNRNQIIVSGILFYDSPLTQ